jgi:hypothetical protein
MEFLKNWWQNLGDIKAFSLLVKKNLSSQHETTLDLLKIFLYKRGIVDQIL